MFNPTYILLYVENPKASAEFYAELFQLKPVEQSPTFALFVLPSGLKFGLWIKTGVIPAVKSSGATSEVACPVSSKERVDELCQDFARRGISIAQPPEMMDFGYTFMALDPDGHRLRFFFPSEQ